MALRPRRPRDADRRLVPSTPWIKIGCGALALLWCTLLVVQSEINDKEAHANDVQLMHGLVDHTTDSDDDDLMLTPENRAAILLRGRTGQRDGAMVMPEYGGYVNEEEGPSTTPVSTVVPLLNDQQPPAAISTPEPPEDPSATSTTARTTLTLMETSETTRPTSSPPTIISPSPKPTLTTSEQVHDHCYYERDVGIIERAAMPTHEFCTTNHTINATLAPLTQITLVDAPSRLRAVVFRGLQLDLTEAVAHGPIASLAQDGGTHDPRFRFSRSMVQCSCDEFYAFATANQSGRQWNVWDPALAFQAPFHQLDESLYCASAGGSKLYNVSDGDTVLEVTGRVLLLPRRDDHNPFFQVSAALNAWIMLRAFQWDPRDVTLIHLDDGYPSPIDALHDNLLSPTHAIIHGKEIIGKRLWFSGEVLLAPFETVGPMMQHLDDDEPCFKSDLFLVFREASLAALGLRTPPRGEAIVVTVISREPYGGRLVQRRWLNEDEVLANLRVEYARVEGRSVVFQNFDFAELSLQRQMELMLESDVVIGMHGAGMVNVLWARPGTLVVEIFPVWRRRWGFRNLCQHTGCLWHEFRGGRDTGAGDNASNKFISFSEWRAFFDPLFRTYVANISRVTP